LFVFEAFSASTRKASSIKAMLSKTLAVGLFCMGNFIVVKIARAFLRLSLSALFFCFYSFIAIFFGNLTHG